MLTDKHQIYEGNVRRVFSRLDARLKARGLDFAASLFRSRLRGRRCPAGAHTAAVGAARQLRCGARSGVAPQNSLRAARCAQTAAASQLTKRAKRADPELCAPRRRRDRPRRVPPAAKPGTGALPLACQPRAAKPCPASSAARPNKQRKAVAEGDRSSEAPKAERLRAWFCREDCQTRRNPTCTN
jgi:hypothetical protein